MHGRGREEGDKNQERETRLDKKERRDGGRGREGGREGQHGLTSYRCRAIIRDCGSAAPRWVDSMGLPIVSWWCKRGREGGCEGRREGGREGGREGRVKVRTLREPMALVLISPRSAS
jgi:hypothetical protein